MTAPTRSLRRPVVHQHYNNVCDCVCQRSSFRSWNTTTDALLTPRSFIHYPFIHSSVARPSASSRHVSEWLNTNRARDTRAGASRSERNGCGGVRTARLSQKANVHVQTCCPAPSSFSLSQSRQVLRARGGEGLGISHFCAARAPPRVEEHVDQSYRYRYQYRAIPAICLCITRGITYVMLKGGEYKGNQDEAVEELVKVSQVPTEQPY